MAIIIKLHISLPIKKLPDFIRSYAFNLSKTYFHKVSPHNVQTELRVCTSDGSSPLT